MTATEYAAILFILVSAFGAALYQSAMKRIAALEKETDLLRTESTTVAVTLRYLREAIDRIEQRQIENYNERRRSKES